VTFDPFGDFATEGYLRNFEKEKDLAIVKRAENASFTTGLDEIMLNQKLRSAMVNQLDPIALQASAFAL
jgi:hypothetical protein